MHCQRRATSCLEQKAASDSSVSTLSSSYWPTPFVSLTKALLSNLSDALDKQIKLCNPKQRYIGGLLLPILCTETVKFKTYPGHHKKVEMTKKHYCSVSTSGRVSR